MEVSVASPGFSFSNESMKMERLLGAIYKNDSHFSPAGGSRETPDTSRGTPSVMDTARKMLQTSMAEIKTLMLDIAHANHHLDHLGKPIETNKLPKGLTV